MSEKDQAEDGAMSYEEYIAQEEQARIEEQMEDGCFVTNQPEGQFVRGH